MEVNKQIVDGKFESKVLDASVHIWDKYYKRIFIDCIMHSQFGHSLPPVSSEVISGKASETNDLLMIITSGVVIVGIAYVTKSRKSKSD